MKPLLACNWEPERTTWPKIGSPKLDGIRCLILNGKAYSRNMKPIPNIKISDMLAGLPNMDGELIVGPANAPDVFNRTSSGVMSREGVPDFTYFVFDVLLNKPRPFHERLELATEWANACGPWVQPLPHKTLSSLEEAGLFEIHMVTEGYEGIMLRCPNGPYKQGRSTPREQYLLKVKRFIDGEAEIIGFVEKMHNANELTRDELGRAKRSSHKAGKQTTDTLGALIVRDIKTGVEFEIGTGFTEEQRDGIWQAKPAFIGEIVKYKSQEIGAKNKPRFPVFLGMRPEGA